MVDGYVKSTGTEYPLPGVGGKPNHWADNRGGKGIPEKSWMEHLADPLSCRNLSTPIKSATTDFTTSPQAGAATNFRPRPARAEFRTPPRSLGKPSASASSSPPPSKRPHKRQSATDLRAAAHRHRRLPRPPWPGTISSACKIASPRTGLPPSIRPMPASRTSMIPLRGSRSLKTRSTVRFGPPAVAHASNRSTTHWPLWLRKPLHF